MPPVGQLRVTFFKKCGSVSIVSCSPSRGLLRDREIFGNLWRTFVSSSNYNNALDREMYLWFVDKVLKELGTRWVTFLCNLFCGGRGRKVRGVSRGGHLSSLQTTRQLGREVQLNWLEPGTSGCWSKYQVSGNNSFVETPSWYVGEV